MKSSSKKSILQVCFGPASCLLSPDNWCHRNPKNYQVWFHRRWLTEQIHMRKLMNSEALFERETETLNTLIQSEPKHYNAWSHKLFLSKLFKVYESNLGHEISFTQKFIESDVRNNSAWSYRRHCFSLSTSVEWDSEVSFALACIKQAPSNESPWVYLRSIPEWFRYPEIESVCSDLQQLYRSAEGRQSCDHRHFVDTLAIMYEKTGRKPAAFAMRDDLAESDLNRQSLLRFRNQSTDSKSII